MTADEAIAIAEREVKRRKMMAGIRMTAVFDADHPREGRPSEGAWRVHCDTSNGQVVDPGFFFIFVFESDSAVEIETWL